MWQEGQKQIVEDDSFDDVSQSFVLCALHQTKIIRDRWKYWSGSVPSNIDARLQRLKSLLSIDESIQEQESTKTNIQNDEDLLQQQPQLSDPIVSFPSKSDTELLERIQPRNHIIIQGPDIQPIIKNKRHFSHLWCCQ